MRKIIVFFLAVLVFNSNGQTLANYNSVRSTGVTYTSINASGFAFNSWRNTTTFTQDDNRSDFTDIGFDFWYNGVRYTKFCVSTNGFIDFSSSVDDGGPQADDFGYNNASFTTNNTANSTNPAIAPFYDDLTAQGGVDPLGTSIKYTLSGTAPNRTLTVEWINMAVYLNTTPSLNFQVHLIENTGRIKINYGTMNTGTQTFNYSMGLNGEVLNATPTAAQLKELQTVNSNVFSNAIQNNLSAMPAANSQYIFTPPVPANPAGSMTFSGVSQSAMTLNWTNWATNEVGYVIYNSTDGINYNFVTQTAANATSYIAGGLLPATTYFWRLYAVTEGCLSSALTGTQATTAGGNKISIATGNWSNALIWSPNGVPSAGDNVTISSGNIVSMNVSGACNNLTINNLGTLQYATNVGRVLTVNNVTVNTGGTFNVNTGSNVTHTLAVKGNLTNNGTLNFAPDANSLCHAVFSKATGNQTLTGTGATNNFNLITVNIGSSYNNILDVTSSNFSAPTNFLTLTNGTFKLSTINGVNITPFTAAAVLPQSTGIWNNSTNSVISFGGGLTLTGKLTATNGTMNIGNAVNEDLLSSGGTFSVNGGVTNIAGKYYSTGINNLTYFSISGGTVNVPTSGSTDVTNSPFQITGAGSSFNMTGGLIVILREGETGAQNLGYTNTGSTIGSVTGGTLQIGNTTSPAAQIININSNYSIGNLNVNSANVTASVTTNNLNIISNVTINSGTLNPAAFNLTLGGNWVNNGGTHTPGTGTTIFNSNSAQSIFKSVGETFNNLIFSGSGVKTFSSAATINSNITINSGASVDVGAANNQLTVRGNYLNNGTINTRSGLILFNGTVVQTIGGTSATNFYNLTLNNNAGATLTSAQNLINTLTLSNGVFNTNTQVFTMVSTATMTARIAQIVGTGNINGNVTVQRFAPAGTTGWALIGTPISSALTLNDWDDDIPISCPTCPDGSASGFLSIYTYDETKPGLNDDPASYIPLSTINDPIIPNKGYWVYLGTGSATTTDITLDVRGSVRKFNTSIPLSKTNNSTAAEDGWNLIHNPYPSAISWTGLRNGNANVDNAIYAYNADLNGGAGAHATYINNVSSPAVGAGGIGDNIPMSQGFYVHCTAATNLTAQESNKVSGNPTFLKIDQSASGPASSVPLVRFTLKNATGFEDETVLYYQSGATDNFDGAYDAYKMSGQDPKAPTIALEKTNKFQVNGIHPVSGNFSMPMKTLTGYTGTYTITAVNISSFPSGSCVNLYDRFTGITTDLKTSDYVFTLADTTTVARFNVNISANPLNINSTIDQPSCLLQNSGQITAIGANAGPWNYYWKNSVGTIIKTSLNKAVRDTLNNLSNGTFTVEVNTVGTCDNNTSAFVITPVGVPVASFNNPDTTYLSTGGLVSFTNTSSGASSDYWDFGDGIGFSTAPSPNYNYTTVGIYTVTLITTSPMGCDDTLAKTIYVLEDNAIGIHTYSNANPLLVRNLGDNEYLIEQKLISLTDLNFKLFDAAGRLIIDYGNSRADKINLPVNLKGYNKGIYFLIITADNKPATIKLPVK